MGKKRNKKAIVITAILMLAGVLLVLTGFFGGWFVGVFNKDFDFRNIKPEDVGQEIKTDIKVYYEPTELQGRALQQFGALGDESSALIMLDFSGAGEEVERLYFSKYYQHITIRGRLRAMDDAEYSELCEKLYEDYDPYYYKNIEDGKWTDVSLEQFHEALINDLLNLLPYCIEVSSIDAFNWLPFIPAGIILFLIAFTVEICFVFKLKKRIVLPIVYGILIIVPAVLLFNHIRTMLTVKKAGDGLYTMKNLECTDTQGMLDSGAANVNDLINWIFDNHFYGIRPQLEIEKSGCAAFAAVTPEGDHIFGRNFDYPETDTLLVYSHPDGCYESIGVADLGIFGVGQNYPISPDSMFGKLYMVFTPYVIVDGMNEKGVGAGILELSTDEIRQDNGKPDLLIFFAVRAVLDKCASVDEALELLASYDIQSDLGATYHLFITDKTGKYVVVEWLDGEMVVVEHPCCTNSVIAPGAHYNEGLVDDRLPAIENCLGNDRIVTEKEAMEILEKVKDNQITEWSCVYNLDDFTVSICLDGDYTKVYTFRAEELR